MFERRSSALIEDIINCIDRISTYTHGLSFEAFTTD